MHLGSLIILHDIVNIFKFSSTCRYIILSYGSFSAVIGYISFYSDVYYLKRSKQIAWDWKETNNDMCVDKSTKVSKWIEINMLDEYDYIFLGAWNFKDYIISNERSWIENGGKLITHVPMVKILGDI